jgi:flagellum-specific peptidoglycan hydrolase FlgJ
MRIVLSVLILSLLSACSASRVVTTKDNRYEKPKVQEVVKNNENNQPKAKTDQASSSVASQNDTPLGKVAKYIETYSTIAVKEMKSHGVPASITLAQGILESGAGEGDLTKRANNHFGIKCHNWSGAKVYHDDDKKGECFRKYNHPFESFKDHSLFLANRSRYSSLFKLDQMDYKGWAKGLKAAGYATDPKYPNKLIKLIERYKLYEFDAVVLGEATFDDETNAKINKQHTTYRVIKGDTLYSIATKFGLTVEDLMRLNNLKSIDLRIHQVLKTK